MVDGIPCLSLNCCWVFSFYLLLYSILIFEPIVVVSAAHFMVLLIILLHLAVDTVVSHFVSVVSLCFAIKIKH